MFYKLKGLPEEDEIVLCKVTKIFPNSVFVDLLEYDRQGMVHISEISPGRIRNLRDFVSEGRQIVCKVLRLDREKGHIDLSLRRVNSMQRREKLDEIKQELKAESLMVNLAKRLKMEPQKLYKEVADKVLKEYSYIYLCFKDVASENRDLAALGIPLKIVQELTAAILEKFKPKSVTLRGEVRLQTYTTNGIDKIKSLLIDIEKISPTIALCYLGGSRYKLVIEAADYKSAEGTLHKVQTILEKFNDKLSTASFEREKND
ncbi:MAG: S1 RNA-binding domain-containing protein [Nanoarchaeota archaeon]|nr:S1 RNA-binding domain-containing protein [Nanoarchaeota archaeon]